MDEVATDLRFFVTEDRIEQANDETIRSNAVVRSDFDLTNQCLVTLHHLIGSAQWETEGELTILRLGIRIFNSAAAGLKCARSGYYQPAFAQVRDILEVSYLLDLFRQNPEMVGQWLSTKASYKLFSPRAVRKALSKANSEFVPRDEIYSTFCAYATHPTPQGFVIISPEGMLTQTGPFPDTIRISAFLHDLAAYLLFATLSFGGHVRGRDSVQSIRDKLTFMKVAKDWSKDRLPGLYRRLNSDIPPLDAHLAELEELIASSRGT